MSEHSFKKGDRVLVEAVATGDADVGGFGYGDWVAINNRDGGTDEVKPTIIHPHPVVPVADLLEELELATKLAEGTAQYIENTGGGGGARIFSETIQRMRELRTAREAAQAPAFEEGDERQLIGVTEHGDKVYAIDE